MGRSITGWGVVEREFMPLEESDSKDDGLVPSGYGDGTSAFDGWVCERCAKESGWVEESGLGGSEDFL